MMNLAGEDVLICPYNKAHSIIKSRMQFHLTKCRAQNPDPEKVTCPFNSTHVMPRAELDFHQQMCENRYVIDSYLFDVGNSSSVTNVPVNEQPRDEIPCEENWDDEPPVSVLENVREIAKQKDVLLNLIGAPKSERKAHRYQERLRFQQVMSVKEAEKKELAKQKNSAPSSSKASSSLSKDASTSKDEIFAKPSTSGYSSRAECNKEIEKKETTKAADDFELVTHKKSQHKKTKSQQKLRQQENNDIEISQKENISKLKSDNDKRGQKLHPNVTPSTTSTVGRNTENNLLKKNAWDIPLNMGNNQNCASTSATTLKNVDFPSLPVSGRGRRIPAP